MIGGESPQRRVGLCPEAEPGAQRRSLHGRPARAQEGELEGSEVAEATVIAPVGARALEVEQHDGFIGVGVGMSEPEISEVEIAVAVARGMQSGQRRLQCRHEAQARRCIRACEGAGERSALDALDDEQLVPGRQATVGEGARDGNGRGAQRDERVPFAPGGRAADQALHALAQPVATAGEMVGLEHDRDRAVAAVGTRVKQSFAEGAAGIRLDCSCGIAPFRREGEEPGQRRADPFFAGEPAEAGRPRRFTARRLARPRHRCARSLRSRRAATIRRYSSRSAATWPGQ